MPSASGVRAGSAYVELFTNDSALVKGLRSVQSRVNKFGSTISSVGAPLAAIGGGVASLGAVGASALAWPLQLAANLENAQAAFTTLLKDEGKARKLLKDLQSFASSTPFQFDELADASKKLLAFGSDAANVQAELRQIGDIASAIGAPIGEIAEIYGKARVQGRLFAEDINQLTGRGIPVIQELARQFGVTDQEVKQLVSNGEVGFENLEKAFKSLTSGAGQFAGGMERQSKTLTGAFSTLKDNISAAFRPFGEVLLPFAREALNIGTKVVKKFTEWAEANKRLVIPIAAVSAGLIAVGTAAFAAGVAIVGIGAAISAIGTIAGVVSAVIASPVLIVAAAAIGATANILAIGAGLAYVANEAGMLTPAINFVRASFGRVFDTFKRSFGGIVNALKGGQFQLAAKIAWQGVKVATLQGTQQVLKGIDYLWNNAGRLSWDYFGTLAKLTAKVFRSIPKIAFAALRGGAALTNALHSTLGDAFSSQGSNLAGMLDAPIQSAEQRLRKLNFDARGAAFIALYNSEQKQRESQGQALQTPQQFRQQELQQAQAAAKDKLKAAQEQAKQQAESDRRLSLAKIGYAVGPKIAQGGQVRRGDIVPREIRQQVRQLPTPQQLQQRTLARPPVPPAQPESDPKLLQVNEAQLFALRRLVAMGGLQ